MKLPDITISQIQNGLSKKEFSVKELLLGYFEKIKKEDKSISAFLNLNEEQALKEAEVLDAQQGDDLPLKGVPCAMKDNILVEGLKCTAGSKILEDYVAVYDATVTERLKKAGAIIVGKTNLDEFAMGSSTENSAFGPTKNPHDLERVPGGSSGGSAAAVAADFSVFALGSDTGGSIRQPASFCGIVGLKPTWGAVSRYGLIAFASSLDQIGPMAKNVKDARTIFEVISGKDSKDSTTVDFQPKKIKTTLKGLKVGVPKEYFIEGIDPEVKKITESIIQKCQEQGAIIKEISLPHTDYALPVYYIIAPSEASSNLARFDGIRYGLSANAKSKDLLEVYLESRREGFGKEVKRRIMLGTYALSAGYYDAYYLLAQKVKNLIKQDFDKAFKEVDVIFSPTCPTTAFKFGEKTKDPLSMYLSDILTVATNLAGLPALSLPSGFASGLPVGFQIIGKAFEENVILDIGEEIEQLVI